MVFYFGNPLLATCDHAFFIRSLPTWHSSTPQSHISYLFTSKRIVFHFLLTGGLIVIKICRTPHGRKQQKKKPGEPHIFHQHDLFFLNINSRFGYPTHPPTRFTNFSSNLCGGCDRFLSPHEWVSHIVLDIFLQGAISMQPIISKFSIDLS